MKDKNKKMEKQTKKLVLNKETVANLNSDMMIKVKGGVDFKQCRTTITCTNYTYCAQATCLIAATCLVDTCDNGNTCQSCTTC